MTRVRNAFFPKDSEMTTKGSMSHPVRVAGERKKSMIEKNNDKTKKKKTHYSPTAVNHLHSGFLT